MLDRTYRTRHFATFGVSRVDPLLTWFNITYPLTELARFYSGTEKESHPVLELTLLQGAVLLVDSRGLIFLRECDSFWRPLLSNVQV